MINTVIANSDAVKRNNRSLVLKKIFLSEAINRKQIANDLKITPATVTNITNFLIKNKLVNEEGYIEEVRSGPRARILQITHDKYCICAVHIGVNILKLGVTTLKGEILDYVHFNMTSWTKDEIAKKIIDFVNAKKENTSSKIIGVGMCISGSVSYEQQKIISAMRADFDWFPLAKTIENATGISTWMDGLMTSMGSEYLLFSTNASLSNSIIIYDGGFLGMTAIYGIDVLRGAHNMFGALGKTSESLEKDICIPAILKGKMHLSTADLALSETEQDEKTYTENVRQLWRMNIEKSKLSNKSIAKSAVNKRVNRYTELLLLLTAIFDPNTIYIKSIYSCNSFCDDIQAIIGLYNKKMLAHSQAFPKIEFEELEPGFSVRSGAAIVIKELLNMNTKFDFLWSE